VNAETLLSLLLCVFSATSPLIRASSPPRLALESHPCPINTGTETHPKTTFHPPAPIIICMLITNQLQLTASSVKSWIGFCKCDNAIGDKKIRGQKSCLESLRVPVRYLLPAAEIRARSYWLQPNSEFGSIDSYSPKPPMIRNRTLNLSVLGHYYFAAAAPASPKSCAFIESTFRTHESNLPNTSEELSLRSGCARLGAFSLFPHFPIGATQFDQYWHCAQPVNCILGFLSKSHWIQKFQVLN
jgi:hypothetical protein